MNNKNIQKTVDEFWDSYITPTLKEYIENQK